MSYSGIGYDGFRHEWIPSMQKIRPTFALTQTSTGDIMAFGACQDALQKLARAMFDKANEYTIGANPHFPRYALDPYGKNKS